MTQKNTTSGNAAAERAAKKLESLVKKNDRIFIDTCSVLNDAFVPFMAHIIPLLKKESKNLIVPLRVVDELKKISDDQSRGDALRKKALLGLDAVTGVKSRELFQVMGEDEDNFADNVFLTVFTKFRLQYKMLLVTQDNGLADDISNLNNLKSNRGKPIVVQQINQYGNLSPVGTNNTHQNSHSVYQKPEAVNKETQPQPHPQRTISKNTPPKRSANNSHKANSTFRVAEDDKFELFTKPTAKQDSVVPVMYLPREGGKVKSGQTGIIELRKNLASGGEGVVYETQHPDYVCKIYHENCITKFRLQKLERILFKEIQCPGVCLPCDVVVNKDDFPVGYLMPKADGRELQRSFFIPPLLKKYFSHWTRVDAVQMALTILKQINHLHQYNVVLGDINPMNILVVSPTEVYFVDTDSYQIEDIPCPVGTINFTPPEAQGKSYTDFLRKIEHEYFAVATLLFMIMHPGKPPYSQQGGGDPAKNIQSMNFSYPFGEQSNKKTPDGPWRFCWSHMPFKIKEAFYETFTPNGKWSKPDDRLSTEDWIAKFEEYHWLLTSGKFLEQDPMSGSLFPTRFKRIASINYEKCKLCGQEVDAERLEAGMCSTCLNQGDTYYCKQCGREMVFSNYLKHVKKMKKRYDYCKDCNAKRSLPFERRACSDCHRMFDITYGDKWFFESKGWHLPKKCRSCRDAAKGRIRPSYRPVQQAPVRKTSRSSKSSGIAGFFKKLFS